MKKVIGVRVTFIVLVLFSYSVHAQNQWIDSVKKVLEIQKADTNKVKTLLALSDSYQMNYPDSGLICGQKALALAETIHYDWGIFWSIVFINKSLYVLGNYALELDYAFRAFPLGKKLNDPYTNGWANGMIGDCYFNLGQYDSSLKYYREVIRLAEQSSIIDLFSIYSALTPTFIKMHQNDSALIYAKKGYQLFKENPLLNTGNDDTKWAKCFQFRFLGDAFAANSDYDSSLYYYYNSLKYSEDIHVVINKIDVYNGIAKVFKDQHNIDSATWYAKKVLSEKIAKIYPVGLLTASNTLADIYELLNKPDSTLKYLRMALSMKDSLFNRDKTIAIQNVFFKEREKQKEIQSAKSALQKKYSVYFLVTLFILILITTAIVLRNRRIKQLQSMRNSIADDLHDDIGSALSSISIMNELAKAKSPGALLLLDSIGESTAAIQENMSDIVWAVNPQNDHFGKISQRMRLFASEMMEAKDIALVFTDDPSLTPRLTMKQRKNFYFFFKEVINNAAKYSGAKQVTVFISHKDHHIIMLIRDDGKGFDTTAEFPGNGMSTLKKRAAELNADFEIMSRLNEGTTVQLKFKVV